ncbi:MAG: c-type cytochrome domain-containing protein, partial [Verrucomicrobiota bacterium]
MNLRNLILTLLLGGGCLQASAASDREALKFFETEVRPLLAEACFACHDADKQKGSLRLDHLSWMLRGGDSGPAIVPGNPSKSLLIEAVRREDPYFEMPPKEALTPRQVATLEKWVAEGAFWPTDPNAEIAEKTDEHGFTKEDREWWAIQPVQDPEVPANGADWARNEIDQFVARKLSEVDLKPAPDADRLELVRRVYFDLHGLPPTAEEVTAFLEDQRPDAYERLIDKLL